MVTSRKGSRDVEPDPELVEALVASRQYQWNARFVERYSADPGALKAQSAVCADCPRPCEDDEVCLTVVGHEERLFDQIGRDQAFHLLESGMHRLQLDDVVDVRETNRPHPNMFVSQVRPK